MRFINYLTEKLIVLNGTKSKKYGNIVLLAGGGGSGKGFAVKNFLEGDLFKIRDIDEIKTLFLKLGELKEKYSELKGLDLRNPKDVFKLHKFVASRNIKLKSFENLMKGVKPGYLPNVLFDITFKDIKGSNFHWVEMMIDELGYDPKDVNLIWVLTDYALAVKQNRDRKRVVPDDILLQTHEGAALNMIKVIKGQLPQIANKKYFDGAIHVILNNRENTVFWTDKTGEKILTKPSKEQLAKGIEPAPVIKDFKYLTLKEKGKKLTDDKDVHKQIYDWIIDNVPRSVKTQDIWKDTEKNT